MASVVLAVVGINQYDDYGTLERKVNREIERLTDPLREIIVSEDRGVSALGREYALNKKVKHRVFKADWDTNGKQAGFLRNHDIVAAAHRLIIFYDGKCRYTKDLIDRALGARKLVKIVNVVPTQLTYTFEETKNG